MAAVTEGSYAGEFAVCVDDESKDACTVLSGETLTAGTVVGLVSRGIGRAVATAVSGTGNGTMTLGTPHVGPDVQVGTYVIKCLTKIANSGTFSVTCPDGTRLANATVATAYESTHVRFTLNDGSTDYEVNDQFTIVVSTTAPAVVGTGNGTITALALNRGAKPGLYQFTCIAVGTTHGGTFQVTNPEGHSLGQFSMSDSAGATSAFTSPEIDFSLVDGSTNFAVGDVFGVVVHNLLVAKVAAWTPRPTTWDGRHVAAGVSWSNYDASGGDVKGLIVARDATVNASELAWKTGLLAADQAAGRKQLLALGIVSR